MRPSRRFLSAYRALLGGQDPREPSAWLGTIARNECRTRLRGRRTEPLTLVREPVGDELQREVDRHDEIRALCSALAELPPQQRDAIVLREFYGLSYAEVGAALGLSGPAVESVIFRSRKRLQDQLRPARSALGVLTLPLSLRDGLGSGAAGLRRRWRHGRRRHGRVGEARLGSGRGEGRRSHACGRRCRHRGRAREHTRRTASPPGTCPLGAGHSGAQAGCRDIRARAGRVRFVIPTHARAGRRRAQGSRRKLARRPDAAGRGREPFRREQQRRHGAAAQQWR